MNKTRLFPSQTCRDRTYALDKCSSLYGKLNSLHQVPDLPQTEHAQFGVILWSLLGGQQSSKQTIKGDYVTFQRRNIIFLITELFYEALK